ncbi:hypothetical protein ACXYTJ_16565 [Gilvimarinus sp. F26214L]|uniref:hypothetical protein n=1 Tax=Gilvimarinus sp. DZF01 TaxID=3461371 RepID=UPI0040451C3A
MHYSKAMIELVFEIRRRVKSELKPGIKLANPGLMDELAEVYHSSKDTILRTLIKELLNSAGEHWPQLLAEIPHSTPPDFRSTTVRVYRGQVSLEAAAGAGTTESTPASDNAANADKPVRYYRGVPIP